MFETIELVLLERITIMFITIQRKKVVKENILYVDLIHQHDLNLPKHVKGSLFPIFVDEDHNN